MRLRSLALIVMLAALALSASAQAAIPGNTIRIGFITDMSSVFSRIDGEAGAGAIRMAIADMGGEIDGKKIELMTADHHDNAGTASLIARKWFTTQHLDVLIGGTDSATGLAMAAIAAKHEKPFIGVGPGTAALTNAQCTPFTVHYAYSTTSLARGTGSAVTKEGGKTWYILTYNYAFGKSMAKQATAIIDANGGKVLHVSFIPLGTTDYSSYVLAAQASGAKVLGIGVAGTDFVNAMKATWQFEINKTMTPVALIAFVNGFHALGVKHSAGTFVTVPWYWDLNKASRAWSKRFFQQYHREPSYIQAGDYSAALTYLKAVKATHSVDGPTIMKYLKSHKINDMFAHDGYVRADGVMMHDMYLVQVKTPTESKGAWDLYKPVRTIPAVVANGPLSASTCPLLKHRGEKVAHGHG